MSRIAKTLLLTGAAALLTLPTLFFGTKPADANSWCWCTQYVANRFGLSGFPDAGDWNDGYLQSRGFQRVGAEPGAIVVMERNFPGSNAQFGHVGIVESVLPDGRINVRGSNQGVSAFSEAGCNNVNVTLFRTAAVNNPSVSFWKRGTSNPGNNTGNIFTVNFSGIAAPTGVNIRSAPSTTASIVGRIAPNQRISFDAWTFGEVVPDYWTKQPDARWYRIAGTNQWVASAVVNGNAPGSCPTP